MRIRLTAQWVDYLNTVPESGMGYQRVDVRLADGRALNDVLVFNGEWLEVPEEYRTAVVVDLRLSDGPKER